MKKATNQSGLGASISKVVNHSTHRSEAGDTLVELLIAMVVLAIASVAILVAFATSISASSEHPLLPPSTPPSGAPIRMPPLRSNTRPMRTMSRPRPPPPTKVRFPSIIFLPVTPRRSRRLAIGTLPPHSPLAPRAKQVLPHHSWSRCPWRPAVVPVPLSTQS